MKTTQFEASVSCPDCNSETRLIEIAPNVYTAAVLHDDTCPWLAEQETRS
ncbi:hypothetical protein [Microbacterium soli]